MNVWETKREHMLNNNWFDFRRHLDEHSDPLTNVGRPASTAYQELDQLLDGVFSEQRTVFGAEAVKPPASGRLRTFSQILDWLPYAFYRGNFRVSPIVHRGAASAIAVADGSDACVDFVTEHVFENLSFEAEDDWDRGRRSATYVLTGGIGTGKSALVKQMLASDFVYGWVKSRRGWFLRINFETVSHLNPFSEEVILVEVLGALRNVASRLKKEFKAFDDVAWAKIQSSVDDCQRVLRDGDATGEQKVLGLINDVSVLLKCRPVIIFDNVDFVFYRTDEVIDLAYGVDQDAGQTGASKVIVQPADMTLSFADFVRKLVTPQSEWGRLGANQLLVVRDENYEDLARVMSKNGGTVGFLINQTQRWSISYEENYAPNVLIGRLRFLLCALHMLCYWEFQNLPMKLRPPAVTLQFPMPAKEWQLDAVSLKNTIALLRSCAAANRPGAHPGDEHSAKAIKLLESKVERLQLLSEQVERLITATERKVRSPDGDGGPIDQRIGLIGFAVWRIASAGMRDTLRIFRSMSWLSNELALAPGDGESDGRSESAGVVRQGSPLTTMIAQRPNLAIMTFILNLFQRYSEEMSMFPNIFLGHARNYHLDTHNPTYPDYWLVPHILSHVCSRRMRRAHVDDLFSCLCREPSAAEIDENPDHGRRFKGVYDWQGVAGTLLRLQKINGPRVLRFRTETDITSRKVRCVEIELTERGRRLVEGDVGDPLGSLAQSFLYLQLIVDDWMLPLPPELFDADAIAGSQLRSKGVVLPVNEHAAPPFAYLSKYGYGYIVRPDYPTTYLEVMNHKLTKLAKFLGLMKAAQDVESMVYWAAWSRLRISSNTYFQGWIYNVEDVLFKISDEVHNWARRAVGIITPSEAKAQFDLYYDVYRRVFLDAYRR